MRTPPIGRARPLPIVALVTLARVSQPVLEPAPPHTRFSFDSTREWTRTFSVLDEMIRQDSAELRREVLLWQRWIRYAATAVFALVGFLVQRDRSVLQEMWLPFAGALAAYVLVIAMMSWWLVRGEGRPVSPALPALALSADLAALALGAHLALPPDETHLILIVGYLTTQLAAFHFGLGYGIATTLGSTLIYAVEALHVPSGVPGDRPGMLTVLGSVLAYTTVSAVSVATFGSFRARMNALRHFCKRVEVGDLTVAYDTEHERRPDDLTLLARSVDTMRQRLIELVGTDPLTGCLNRRALEMRLKREWRAARRRDANLAVLAIDVDNFKPINDTHGHPVGDVVLKELALVMRETARDTDVIARVGGDEFVLLLPDTGWQGAVTFAERLRRQVDEGRFGEGMRLPVTISVGIALARGTDDVKASDLLEEADRSLYRAKTSGRNRVGA